MISTRVRLSSAIVSLIAMAFLSPGAMAVPCIVPNSGGTADLPPDGCAYTAPEGDVMQILPPALPAGSTIEMIPMLHDFSAISEVVGGSLGGHQQTYDALLELAITGTGDLGFFARTLSIPVSVETHSAARTPGDAVQSFATEMVELDGTLLGDPDFTEISILAGTANAFAGSGHTTLTRLGPPGSSFDVDSFFDIEYSIDFEGAPGSALEGFSGRTPGGIRLQTETSIPEPSGVALAIFAMLLSCLPRRR